MMTKNDEDLLRPTDPAEALGLLTRLPLPGLLPKAETRGARAAWAYPLAGLVLGLIAALAGWLALGAGLPAGLAGLLALGVLILASGAIHEDGLADTADGLWGGWDRARRLEIMKDSRIGTYGVLALVLGVALRGGALALFFAEGPGPALAALLAAAALSRAAMVGVMAALPHARDDGLSRGVGRPSFATAALAAALALGITILCAGPGGLAAAFWTGVVTWAMIRVARRKIGGQTGDILGATQQLAEIAVLLSLLA